MLIRNDGVYSNVVLDMKSVRRLAASYGAYVKTGHMNAKGSRVTLNVTLPRGRVWNANGEHDIFFHELQPMCVDYDKVVADMRKGIKECRNPLCDTCFPRNYD